MPSPQCRVMAKRKKLVVGSPGGTESISRSGGKMDKKLGTGQEAEWASSDDPGGEWIGDANEWRSQPQDIDATTSDNNGNMHEKRILDR